MKIAIALVGIVLAAALVVSATMGAETLVPGGGSGSKSKLSGSEIGANGKPRLMPTSVAPPTLKGTNFKPGENVTVKVEGRRAKKVQANGSGSFTVRFAARVERCNGMTATAVGDKGSRAAFQLAELMCAMSGASQ
ncbi:MAG: hypothetical protein ACJ75P_09895 [Gaiellaceae bacterium]